MTQLLLDRYFALVERMNGVGTAFPPLVLRLIMAWEFFESGREKLHGQNWFADIQSSFPFPFNHVPAGLSWGMATWFELVGAVLLLFGLATRWVAFSLLVLTFVATAAVHWPSMWDMWSDLLRGYAISDKGYGNFKLPLLFAVMLLPLVFSGAGKLSLDHAFSRMLGWPKQRELLDVYAAAIACLLLAIPFLLLLPTFGALLLGCAGLLAAIRYATVR